MSKRKSLILVFSVILILSTVLSGCSAKPAETPNTGGTTPAPAKDVLELKSADTVANESPYTIAINKIFVPMVKEKTNGRLNVTHYNGGQLGSDSGMLEGVKMGTIDFITTGTVGSKVTDAFYLPWLFKDADHMHRVLDGEIGELIKQKFHEETGLVMIGTAYFGSRLLTANKEIKTLADLKGLKIRVPQIAPMVDTWKALGASPTPLAFTELFTALQSKTVDAQENPAEIVVNNSFYEVQKYLMLTNHALPVRFMTTNEKLWNSLTTDEQKAITEAWKETANEIEKLYLENEQKYIQACKDKGMILVEPNIDEFREATKDIYKKYADTAWGTGVYDQIQALRDK